MTDSEIIETRIAEILRDWAPLPQIPLFAISGASGWLIGGLYRGTPYWKHTGMAPDSPDTPDDPIAAALWLDAHAKSRHQGEVDAPPQQDSPDDHSGDGIASVDSAAVSDLGQSAGDGGGDDGSGTGGNVDHGATKTEAPDLIAMIDERKPEIWTPLDADSTDASAHSSGMLIEKDEIARLIKALAVDIAYRREDLLISVNRRIQEIQAFQVQFYGERGRGPTEEVEAERSARFNIEQTEYGNLTQRKNRIERFADDARKGLEGKSLEILKAIDIAALPWPT